jgi:hypothetical protein
MRQYGVTLRIHVQELIKIKNSTPVLFFLNAFEYLTSVYIYISSEVTILEYFPPKTIHAFLFFP